MKNRIFNLFFGTLRRALLTISLTMYVVLTILRESGSVTLSYYQSQITYSANSNWSGNSLSLNSDSLPDISSDPNCPGIFENGEIPILVKIDGLTYGDHGVCGGTTFYCPTPSYGLIWTPLIKMGSVSELISLSHGYSYRITQEGEQKLIAASGLLKVKYQVDFRIIGFCSYREARELIREEIAEAVYRQAKISTQQKL